MTKKLIILFIGIIPTFISAQDIVIRENGEVISCKITKVDSNNIYFDIKRDNNKVSTFIPKDAIQAFQYDTDLPKYYSLKKPEPSPNDSVYPRNNRFMLELSFNPFGNDGVFSFDYLQTKFWVNNKTALRLGVKLDYKNSSLTEDDYPAEDEYSPTVSAKSFLIGIKPGIEFRILENTKVSPYWGFEFSYTNKSSSAEYGIYEPSGYNYDTREYDYQKITTKIDGAWRNVTYQEYQTSDGLIRTYETIDNSYERAFSSYGLNLVLGTDLFVYKSLYLGFEVGLGYEVIKNKQIEITEHDPRITDYGQYDDNSITIPSNKSTEFGFYYNSSIRLGVYF